MAEGFEGCHVPQQSRRDKLRVVTAQNHPPCLEPTINLHRFAGLLPMYDPSSLISSDLLNCASATGQDFHNHHHHHHHNHHHHQQSSLLPGLSEGCKENAGCSIKEEGVNLMGFAGNLMNTPPPTSSSRLHQTLLPYFDLQSSLPMNPSPIQDINSNPLFYSSHTLQNRRDFDHAYSSGGEVVVFKPEPLSLSLSSHPTYQNSHQLELNLQRYGSGHYPPPIVGSMSNNISRSAVPFGPFTGYASILKGSRFLRPAQQLLEEFCEIWCQGNYSEKLEADSGLMDSPSETLGGIFDDSFSSGGDGGESRRKKSRLISMLDEVYRRYKQYYQQMQEVVASFECVSGLGNAAPYANLAIISMSKHFRCLKNAISDQLRITNKAPINYCQKYGPNSGFLDQQPVWRPQRGLPERAVTVLRAWLFEHFLHPYPTDTDKVMLAKQTGLSRSQVSNWFINARVRLWKPMVEEIHMLETRQGQKHPQREDRALNRSTDHLPLTNSLVSDNASKSTQLVQDIPSKQTRNELQNLGMANEGQLNLSYNNLSSQDPQMDVNVSIAGGKGGVSLTLGLHQNNVIDLSEPFAMNAVQRYGLGIEDNINNGDGYVMGGFESQSRHFARDVIGGQLLHDFVG